MANKMSLTDYEKRYKQMQDSGSTSTSINNQTTTNQNANEDYYQMAKQQEYSALLDKEVQLENARANALKYTTNQLAAQGMSGSGYANNVQTGIYNQYLNRLTEAKNTTEQNIADLNQAQREEELANANDRFQSVTTMLSQATELGQMDQLLADYGYGTIDASGNFVWNEKPTDISNDDWNQIRYYYGLQKDAIESNLPNNFSTYNSQEAWQNATYVDHSGNIAKISDGKFERETNYLWHYASTGQFNNGDTIMMKNDKGDTIYVEMTSSGFRIVDDKTYNESNTKYSIVYSGGKIQYNKVS